MSLTTMLRQWLTAGAKSRRRTAKPNASDTRCHATTPTPLQSRTPWQAWQLLSWVTITLLAPPFWVIGILLMINSHSDNPLFWPLTMAIVGITNAVAIMDVNQRHHCRPFTGYAQLALHYFGASMLTGCALFLLLLWSTGILQDFAGPLTVTGGTLNPASATLWTAAVVAGFGVLSFGHASVLHAWLAFEG